MKPDTKACFLDHMGMYAMREESLSDLVAGIRAGMVEPMDRDDEQPRLEVRDGVAIIPLEGAIMKKRSKFGGASTIDTRALLRAAVEDRDVKSVIMKVNSPGGLIAGVDELHREVKRTNAVKPVDAHIEDLGASAGYWAVLGCRRITANRAAEVGSVGVIQVVYDSSEEYKREGVKVLPLRSGKLKGGAIPGSKISAEQLADMQDRVDKAAEIFFEALGERKISAENLDEIKKGGVYFAQDAQKLGLIDEVCDFEDVMKKHAEAKPGLRAGDMRLSRSGVAAFGRGVELMAKVGDDYVPVADLLTHHQPAKAAGDAKKTENPVDAPTATMAQSAVLAGVTSETVMADAELKAKLEALEKENAELKAAKAKPESDSEADINAKVDAEVKKRTLIRARKEAAAELVKDYGASTGLTDKLAEAFFARCESVEEVDAEMFLRQGTLKNMAGGNAVRAAEPVANLAEKAAGFKAKLADEKKRTPENLTGAMLRAKLADPTGYRAFMAAGNGGRDMIGFKQGRVSA